LVSNTAYGTVGRRFNHGVAALPNNGEVILTRAEGGRKGNKLGKVPHQRVVLQGRAGIGDRRCSGGNPAVQARLDGACTWGSRARGADVVEGERDGGPGPEAERRSRLAVEEVLRNTGTRQCRGASHGGARRRGGQSAVAAMAWKGRCAGGSAGTN